MNLAILEVRDSKTGERLRELEDDHWREIDYVPISAKSRMVFNLFIEGEDPEFVDG